MIGSVISVEWVCRIALCAGGILYIDSTFGAIRKDMISVAHSLRASQSLF